MTKFQGGHAAFLERPEQFAATFDRFATEILETGDIPMLRKTGAIYGGG